MFEVVSLCSAVLVMQRNFIKPCGGQMDPISWPHNDPVALRIVFVLLAQSSRCQRLNINSTMTCF